ncbi:PH domain-containing protein, putative [Hepatocystis sp. ex Piliocolobus tephrosceles]|nr:PH domain-containing protein, putative [Hepatocystis sp. ex Piliocolobus tephrosceles]
MEETIESKCNNLSELDKEEQKYFQFSDDFVCNSSFYKISPNFKEGYLEKRVANSWSCYKKRWFRLQNKKLYYFKNKEDTRPCGVLDIALIHMNIIYDQGVGGNNSFHFVVANICCSESRVHKATKNIISYLTLNPVNTDFKLYLRGEDADIFEWFELLNASVDYERLIEQPKFVFTEHNFWKLDRISVDVFEKIADTGDILLFRSKVMTAKIQRVLTRGEYDHIGMILRNDKNDLFILEALSNMGVILTPWYSFKKNKWIEQYTRIALRRLIWDNCEENLQKLLNFLKNTVGKKYDLKIINFLVPKMDDNGYFCSELIAECWKIMGVIPKNTPSSYIWPSNFSKKFEDKIQLQSGCQLNNELYIDFSL